MTTVCHHEVFADRCIYDLVGVLVASTDSVSSVPVTASASYVSGSVSANVSESVLANVDVEEIYSKILNELAKPRV